MREVTSMDRHKDQPQLLRTLNKNVKYCFATGTFIQVKHKGSKHDTIMILRHILLLSYQISEM